MRAHLKYLRYVVLHKVFVLRAGLVTGAPLWRLLIHDASKFLPCEWFPYVRYFNGQPQIGERLRCVVDNGGFDGVVVRTRPGQPAPMPRRAHWDREYRLRRDDGFEYWVFPGEVEIQVDAADAFDRAWLHHLHANPHHHQHWVLRQDDGEVKALPMPPALVREMVADWAGAGRAITGRWEVAEWYAQNREKMVLHPETRAQVEHILATYRFPSTEVHP